jgi:hypothetical protein
MLFAYGSVCSTFYQKSGQGIKSVEIASAGLASGVHSNGYSSNLAETQKIVKADQQGARRSSSPNGICRANQNRQFKCRLRFAP